jgi:peroxiredoxin
MPVEVDAPDWSAIPAPRDDGAARHLLNQTLPHLILPAIDGLEVDLSSLASLTVMYAYPRTGRPGIANPVGWDAIPGARGCTPQSCAFRDRYAELQILGVSRVYGLSTQDTAYQAEVAARLHLPFAILSDASLRLTKALNLPVFETSGMTLLKRFTLVIRDTRIVHVFYPIFPPDKNVENIAAWLKQNVERNS